MKRKTVFTFVLICLILIGLVGTDQVLNLGIVRTLVSYTTPVGTVFSKIGSDVSGTFKDLGNINNLQKENKSITAKYNQTLVEIAKLNAEKQENTILSNDLNFKRQNNYDLVEADVTFFNPNDIRDTITIDKGTDDGLKNGDVVLSQGFLVGKIRDITDKTSKIILIVDPDSSIPAVLVGTNLDGLIQGEIGSGLNLNQIPQSEKVTTGELVSTSGLGGSFPNGLIIGKVQNVQQISGSIFQAIEVRPMVDINSLEFVMVIKS